MSSSKRGKFPRSDDMDDDSDDKDSKRKSRNLSEKKRRDQFKLLVNELSSMVSTNNRKMDKSTVLKSTISFLKNHNENTVRSRVHEIQEDWKPSFLTNEEFTHLVLEAVDGFIMVFSTSGQICYASESITPLLGHLPGEILNTLIYGLTCEEERSRLYEIFMDPTEKAGQFSFSCHLRRGGSSPKQYNYELVHFVGYFRSSNDLVEDENRYSGYSGEADTRLVFVGTGRLHTPQLIREMSLVDSSKSEFTSRHSLEWKFLFLDHRAPPIIGYLPFELLGTSGYDYYHVDDLDNVVECHAMLMKKGEGTSCYYRFLTKGQQWIWLQTKFYITYHQWNSKPEFIVCTHQVVSYVDVIKQLRKEENKSNTFELISSPKNAPVQWQEDNAKEIYSEISYNCASISADSPTSKLSSTVGSTNTQITPSNLSGNIEIDESPQFIEAVPEQYVAVAPIEPILNKFSPTTILSPIIYKEPEPTVEHAQLQADLQKKHAELQASIGQQQAELRAISEQLVMVKLGLLTTQGQTIKHLKNESELYRIEY